MKKTKILGTQNSEILNFIIYIYLFLADHYWRNEKNRRQVFVAFAADKGFGALQPEKWYTITKKDMANVNVCAKFVEIS